MAILTFIDKNPSYLITKMIIFARKVGLLAQNRLSVLTKVHIRLR
jgi:hypothetical protein